MNLPASLWLMNFSPQIRPLINALLVTFTTTRWRKLQEYVSQTCQKGLDENFIIVVKHFFLAKLVVDDKKFRGMSLFLPSPCYLRFFVLRPIEIESETIKYSFSRTNYKTISKSSYRQFESAKKLLPVCWQMHTARPLIIYNRTDSE